MHAVGFQGYFYSRGGELMSERACRVRKSAWALSPEMLSGTYGELRSKPRKNTT